MRSRILVILVGLIVLVLGLGFAWYALAPDTGMMEYVVEVVKEIPVDSEPLDAPVRVDPRRENNFVVLSASDIANVDDAFQFVSTVPAGWRVEAVPGIKSINIYDPNEVGASILEQSQIFIRMFTANDFLTLSTVDIFGVRNSTLRGHLAREYDIEKKDSVPTFSDQPSWRSERHTVTDVRVSDASPSVFYVIAKRPSLDASVYRRFLSELRVTSATSLVEPVPQMQSRITKKPFGIFIEPETSPVQPERFMGYHTGIDVEYTDVRGEVEVKAIADGEVLFARRTNGYGGVVVISHAINNQIVSVLYGHLDPESLLSVGTTVNAGQRIGVLGKGGTEETDGERKHLHLAAYSGRDVELRGYVLDESDLSRWQDPLSFWK